ncbi:proline-rich receptor-like protein kinase PERK2 [Iris pallida]|uniref:Proline-rich receptor-like protein kinase PERK2 n=1 Tax=Iris pallida TaxID=29817 RepID=A0AAX6I3N0_IRIPA|nr:proline-rich receptor-like protein kinase PERK2 [Iris pallida]
MAAWRGAARPVTRPTEGAAALDLCGGAKAAAPRRSSEKAGDRADETRRGFFPGAAVVATKGGDGARGGFGGGGTDGGATSDLWVEGSVPAVEQPCRGEFDRRRAARWTRGRLQPRIGKSLPPSIIDSVVVVLTTGTVVVWLCWWWRREVAGHRGVWGVSDDDVVSSSPGWS